MAKEERNSLKLYGDGEIIKNWVQFLTRYNVRQEGVIRTKKQSLPQGETLSELSGIELLSSLSLIKLLSPKPLLPIFSVSLTSSYPLFDHARNLGIILCSHSL